MLSITDMVTLMSAIPTLPPIPSPVPSPGVVPRACGEVNVFYTGFPPYHPLVTAQGWDPARVDAGLRSQTATMLKAGYNVHVVWSGTEVPISDIEERMDQTGVEFDLTAVGYGVRGARIPEVTVHFENLIEMYQRKAPNARRVFNYNPESCLWSVSHRIPMAEDCEAAGKPGKLLGYEEICDSRCDRNATEEGKPHNEL